MMKCNELVADNLFSTSVVTDQRLTYQQMAPAQASLFRVVEHRPSVIAQNTGLFAVALLCAQQC